MHVGQFSRWWPRSNFFDVWGNVRKQEFEARQIDALGHHDRECPRSRTDGRRCLFSDTPAGPSLRSSVRLSGPHPSLRQSLGLPCGPTCLVAGEG